MTGMINTYHCFNVIDFQVRAMLVVVQVRHTFGRSRGRGWWRSAEKNGPTNRHEHDSKTHEFNGLLVRWTRRSFGKHTTTTLLPHTSTHYPHYYHTLSTLLPHTTTHSYTTCSDILSAKYLYFPDNIIVVPGTVYFFHGNTCDNTHVRNPPKKPRRRCSKSWTPPCAPINCLPTPVKSKPTPAPTNGKTAWVACGGIRCGQVFDLFLHQWSFFTDWCWKFYITFCYFLFLFVQENVWIGDVLVKKANST